MVDWLLLSIHECPNVVSIIGSRDGAEVLDSDIKIGRISFGVRDIWNSDWRGLASPVYKEMIHAGTFDTDVGPIRSFKRMLGDSDQVVRQASLPDGNSSVEQHPYQRYEFKKKFFGFTSPIFLALGYMCSSVFFTFSVVLLKKILWGVRFNGSPHFNFAIVLMLFSAALFWIGQWCLFSVLGLLP